jgi:hypothetical protein
MLAYEIHRMVEAKMAGDLSVSGSRSSSGIARWPIALLFQPLLGCGKRL